MLHYFFEFYDLILLVVFLLASVILGRKLGYMHLKSLSKEKLEIVGVAESSVFALLALLIAFTFSGAYDRFEMRKMHLVTEADMFDQAYNYTYVIPKDIAPMIKQDIRDYLDCYIAIFRNARDPEKVAADLKQADIIEEKIWVEAVEASLRPGNQNLAQTYLPAFNNMFETAHTGYYMTLIHPPGVIFVLLIGLAVLGGFLVGYNSAETKQKRPLHAICYVVLTAFTIYVVLNMEYPRIGFINMDVFDNILVTVRNNMV
jgi:hypothetical protein